MSELNEILLHNYFRNLVNKFFKILPMRESEDISLPLYIEGLKHELLGCESLELNFSKDPDYGSLIFILEYIIQNPNCTVKQIKREVFKAIDLCKKLSSRYAEES